MWVSPLANAGSLAQVSDELIDSAPRQRHELVIASALPAEDESAILRAAVRGEVLEATV
jgi:hypothetical protein